MTSSDDIVPPVGRLLPGRVDAERPEHGIIVTFDVPCRSISALDILLIQAPSGQPLRLLPDEQRDANSVFVFFGLGTHAQSLRGWLDRIDDNRWRFCMEPHHINMQNADAA